MTRRCAVLLMFLMVVAFGSASAQDNVNYHITVGANLRLPGNVSQGIYPIIGFDKSLEKKFLVGGFTVGTFGLKSLSPKLNLKVGANLSRQVFWSETMLFNKGPGPQDMLGNFYTKTVEYYSCFNGVVHYVPQKKFSIGAGLGFQFLIASTMKFPVPKGFAGDEGAMKNREFKPVMPVGLIEFTWTEERFLYNFQYQAGLVNRYRGDLADYGRNLFHMVTFEVGYRI